MVFRLTHLLLLCALVASHSLAQSAAPNPAPAPPSAPAQRAPRFANTVTPEEEAHAKAIHFDIATFKPSAPGTARSLNYTNDGFVMAGRPMHDLIRYSFARVRGGSFKLSGQPGWVDTDLYDVQAKVTPESIADWQKLNFNEHKIVLQQFLADYLKLQVHEDTNLYPYYGLGVVKSGIKMKQYQPGDTLPIPGGKMLSLPEGQSPGSGLSQWTTGNDFACLGCNLQLLADTLAGHADKGVLDETGLTGGFNFNLHFNDMIDPAHPDTPPIPFLGLKPDDATPEIRTAIKQLGLELHPTTGQMDGVVIDHIQRPPDN